jgi:hypothetical protein
MMTRLIEERDGYPPSPPSSNIKIEEEEIKPTASHKARLEEKIFDLEKLQFVTRYLGIEFDDNNLSYLKRHTLSDAFQKWKYN